MSAMKEAGMPDFVIELTGTSPLSFEVPLGSVLSVRKFMPSKKGRPSVGGGFKSDAYIVHFGITKIGQVNKKNNEIFDGAKPRKCIAYEVDLIKKRFRLAVFF